jgi:S1-C subfamily serine protease
MRRLIICIFLLFFTIAPVYGANSHMIYYGTSQSGNKYFFVADTIKVMADNTIAVAFICDYSIPKNNVNKMMNLLMLSQETNQFKLLGLESFDADGKAIMMKKFPEAAWQDIKEHTMNELLLKRVTDYISQHPPEKEKPAVKITTGSGFFITQDIVVTNHHVIKNAQQIEVTFNHEIKLPASVLIADTANDLALLKVVGLEKAVHPLQLGNSAAVREGSKIYAVGFPLSNVIGDNAKITDGMINSLTGFSGNTHQFQMSAPIQHGNSGGPLLNERAEVIGVVTALLNPNKVESQNVNFAMKADNITNLLKQLPYTTTLPQTHNKRLDPPDIMETAKKGLVYICVESN